MSLDERALKDLTERSEDEHADGMRATKAPLAELTELGHERRASGSLAEELGDGEARRRSLVRTGLLAPGALATAGLGAGLLALLASPAWAGQADDVQMLQTAASIENLAVATYGVALTLDFIGGASANGVVKAFVTKTSAQHKEHADAFNAAVKTLGGKEQTSPNPVLLDIVNKAKPGLTSAGPVVDLAIQLETDAAQTYVVSTGAVSDASARKLFASIMGIEAQHAAILLAVKALIAGGAPQLIALPPDAAKLPAAAGSVGFPDTFYKTDQARPAAEGAVK
jgi:rubrerythrin